MPLTVTNVLSTACVRWGARGACDAMCDALAHARPAKFEYGGQAPQQCGLAPWRSAHGRGLRRHHSTDNFVRSRRKTDKRFRMSFAADMRPMPASHGPNAAFVSRPTRFQGRKVSDMRVCQISGGFRASARRRCPDAHASPLSQAVAPEIKHVATKDMTEDDGTACAHHTHSFLNFHPHAESRI